MLSSMTTATKGPFPREGEVWLNRDLKPSSNLHTASELIVLDFYTQSHPLESSPTNTQIYSVILITLQGLWKRELEVLSTSMALP